jgi:hypothetical protein
MSVDKFGRYLKSGGGGGGGGDGTGERGPKGIGFELTSDGNYDIQMKKLCNVKDASENGDGANLSTVKKWFSSCLNNSVDDVYDAGNKRITSVGDVVKETDAVNLKYVKTNCMLKDSKTLQISAGNMRITNLKTPEFIYDAVNYEYMSSLINEMSFAIYTQIHKRKKNRLSRSEWKAKIASGDFKWDEMFTVHDTVASEGSKTLVVKDSSKDKVTQ